jgi:hypothetical protein
MALADEKVQMSVVNGVEDLTVQSKEVIQDGSRRVNVKSFSLLILLSIESLGDHRIVCLKLPEGKVVIFSRLNYIIKLVRSLQIALNVPAGGFSW